MDRIEREKEEWKERMREKGNLLEFSEAQYLGFISVCAVHTHIYINIPHLL